MQCFTSCNDLETKVMMQKFDLDFAGIISKIFYSCLVLISVPGTRFSPLRIRLRVYEAVQNQDSYKTEYSLINCIKTKYINTSNGK